MSLKVIIAIFILTLCFYETIFISVFATTKYSNNISIGSSLNRDATFNGSELIINTPSVRENVRLLLAHRKSEEKHRKLKLPPFTYPHITFSGKLEGLAVYSDPYAGSNSNDLNFSGAELDVYIQGSFWISGFMAFDYNSDETPTSNSSFLNRTFITIGNLIRSPFYLSMGQIYLPFGRYNSLLVTTTVTQFLGRIRARTIELGYQQTGDNALNAELYVFQGLINDKKEVHNHNEWGADIGYKYKFKKGSSESGVGFSSNLSDSQGFQATAVKDGKSYKLNTRVPAYDIYSAITVDPFVLIGEYIQATKSFKEDEVPFANHGARPAAYHIEGDRTFISFGRPSTFGLAYGGTNQALALGLPQKRYSVVYNIAIWRDTNLAIEYRHDINYPKSAASTSTDKDVKSGLGKSDNAISLQFDMYF